MLWILWLYLLNTIFLLIVAIREVRRPAKALNWVAIGLILPVLGFVLYLSTTNPARVRLERLISQKEALDALPDSFGHASIVIARALQPLTVHGLRTSQVQVLTNGMETYETLIESIQNAKKTIDLEYYIYRDDQVGRRITDVLIERAAAGVQVRFVRDGFGSRKFPRSQVRRMMSAGIECRTFFPARLPWVLSNWNYRDHCKIVVIDRKVAFTGGINVGNEYIGLNPNVGFWRDTHLRIEGNVALDLQAIFGAHWNIASPERMDKRVRGNTQADETRTVKIAPHSPAAFSGLSAQWGTEFGNLEGTRLESLREKGALQKTYVQTLEGNPGIPTPAIREAYFICLTQATKTIDISTPYFIPDADIIMALKTAVARGVRVRLLLPRHGDLSTVIVLPASRTYFGELLEAGVQIYQYNKGMLHAKLMIVDGEIAEVGSANYDLRSHRLNYEVCEILYSADLARELTEQFERDLTDSVTLRVEDIQNRPLPQRILDQGARLLSPLL